MWIPTHLECKSSIPKYIFWPISSQVGCFTEIPRRYFAQMTGNACVVYWTWWYSPTRQIYTLEVASHTYFTVRAWLRYRSLPDPNTWLRTSWEIPNSTANVVIAQARSKANKHDEKNTTHAQKRKNSPSSACQCDRTDTAALHGNYSLLSLIAFHWASLFLIGCGLQHQTLHQSVPYFPPSPHLTLGTRER